MSDSARGRRRVSSRRGRLASAGRPAASLTAVREGFDGRIRLVRSSSSSSSCSSAVARSRSPPRATSASARKQQQTRVVELPAHRGAILDRHGRELAVGTPQQTVYAAPSLLDDPIAATGDLCTALQIKRRKDKLALLEVLSQQEERLRLRGAQGRPGSRQGGAGARTCRASAPTRRRRAAIPMQGLGGAGDRLCRRRQQRPRGHRVQVRQGAGRPGRQPARRARPRRAAHQDDLAHRAGARRRRARSRWTPTSRSTPRMSSSAPCARRPAKGAVAVVMDPRTGELLALVNVPIVKDHDFGRWHRERHQRRRQQRLRAGLDLQDGDRRRGAGRRPRDAAVEVHSAVEHPRRRPRDQRVA